MIWDHDNAILQEALAFYDELNNRLSAGDWLELCSMLDAEDAPEGIDAHCGSRCAAPTRVSRPVRTSCHPAQYCRSNRLL